MEAVIFVLALLGIIVLIMFLQFINSRRDDKLYLLNLENEFGKIHRSSYDHDRLITADAYFKCHMPKDHIDDITWSDLSLDEIFSLIDKTESDSGRQVLYHMLRCPLTDVHDIENRRSIIDTFRKDVVLRKKAQLVLHHVGSTGRASVYDLLDSLGGLEEKNRIPYYVRMALLVLAFLSIYLLKGIGVLIFLGVLISNLYVYYRDRSRILPYLKVYAYVLKTMEASERIAGAIGAADVTDPADAGPGKEELKKMSEDMKKTLSDLKPLKRHASYSLNSEMGNDPVMVLLNLAGIFVFADIIRFWKIRKNILDHKDDIDRLIYLTGSIDAYISMAGYTEAISAHLAKYEVAQDGVITAEGIVHPLIEEPVPNSVTVKKSILLTGANASGKSTFLKSMALAALYAQTLGYVCADVYKAPICRVMSAMSIKDSITEGDSYYMAEIKAVKRMTDYHAGRPLDGKDDILQLCFVDELLSGTNTEERIAACTRILMFMDEQGIRVMAATHDMELTDLLSDQYENYHFEEDLSEGDVIFSYKLKDGGANSRNAIRLLESLGFDAELTERARKMVKIHSEEGVWKKV